MDIKVNFQAEGHKYTDNKNNVYTSVTQAIHLFVPPFDTDYWSKFKADKYSQQKFQDKEWTAKEVQTMWKEQSEEACNWGTSVHDANEEYIKSYCAKEVYDKGTEEQKVYFDFIDKQEYFCNFNNIETEFTEFNSTSLIAGRVDLRLRRGREVQIDDWKTNKEIKFKGFKGERMLAPFSHLQNCNFEIYKLQLSVYALLDEDTFATEVKKCRIIHMRDKKIKVYDFSPMRKEASYIIKHGLLIKNKLKQRHDLDNLKTLEYA